MSVITGIEALRGLVEIQADGYVALRARRADFEKCPLRPGDNFDLDEYVDRLAAVQTADAYEDALTRLDVRACTSGEIERALRRRGYVTPAVAAVVQRLRESGLIDDARCARRMAETAAGKGMGRYALKRRLRAKGISDADADDALSTLDDAQQQAACLEAAQSLARRYAELPPREGKARLAQALARRGFAWDAVESALDQLFD